MIVRNLNEEIRSVLRRHPGLRFMEIKRRTGIDSSGLSARLCQMLGRGIIRRRGEPRKYRWYVAKEKT